MKKKIIISVIVAVILLAVLLVPIPAGTLDDGGTRIYTALTYKIVSWNKVMSNGVYKNTSVYFGADRRKTVDELWELESETIPNETLGTESFLARVVGISGNVVVVEPLSGEPERDSYDKISFTAPNNIDANEGSVVRVVYSGNVAETYPAQIDAETWSLYGDLRHMKYDGPWPDMTEAVLGDAPSYGDFNITEIYADCFFAHPVTAPMSIMYKFKGELGEEWCVGDQVLVEYKNVFYNGTKTEADVITVKESDFVPQPGVAYKPVIYLYPEKETEVSVKLALNGSLTCTYPEYNDGWSVTASPDGTLRDSEGRIYNYLYWEGEANTDWDMSRGFCVKGEDTAAFLEVALSRLGLTRREANEFIVYWLPLMQNNTYNVISFQAETYTDSAVLSVTPSPDTVIRVFMAYMPSNEYVDIPAQSLSAPDRRGFTVVEWGGGIVAEQ